MPRGNPNGRAWIGVDLGGTKMMAGVFRNGNKLIGSARKKTKAHEGAEAGIRRLSELIREAVADARLTLKEVGGIGIGVPGTVDLKKDIVLQMPNLGWKNLPLCRVLEDELGVRVIMANDVDAGLYGEYLYGAGRGGRCVLGVFPGTGIGGACIYEGRVLRGSSRSCLEVGHMKVMPEGPLCGCGRRGCLEAVASRLAIASQAMAAIHRGQAPNLASLVGTDFTEIRSGALREAIAKGDKVIDRIVRDAAAFLGVGLANLVNVFAPDVIVLGGGLVEAMPSLIREVCEKVLETEVMSAFRGTYQLRIAELGDDAVIAGAAALAAAPAALGKPSDAGERP